MSRFLTDDFINKDPRALLNSAKMATISDLVTPNKQYLTATDAEELTIGADCAIAIAGGGVFKTTLTHINASNLDTGVFTVGKDYYVYLCDPGSNNDEIYVISLNSTYPTGYNATNSRKIGGFHYGECRKVNSVLAPVNASDVVRGTSWESSVFNGILPRSVWTLAHRPKCSPEGMVYLANNTWADIYISSNDGSGGLASIYNATPLTGTEGLCWYDFVERALVVGKRLLTYEEWLQAAYGSPQGNDDNNNNAHSATANTGRAVTGSVANAVSSVGCRDCAGNVWEWLNEFITRAEHTVLTDSGAFPSYDGGRAGQAYTDGNGHGSTGAWAWDTASPFDGYGNIYQYYDYSLVALLAGGNWHNGTYCGARSMYCASDPWFVLTYIGARCACDSL